MPSTSGKHKILRDIVFRSRLLLEGKLVKSIRSNKQVSINNLLRESEENPLYITLVTNVEGTDIRAHIYGYKNEILDCFLDNNPDIETSECLGLVSNLLKDELAEKRINIHMFPPDLIKDVIQEDKTGSSTVAKGVEKKVEIEEETIDFPYIEYLLLNELTKIGLIVDLVHLTMIGKDIVANIKLSDVSELPSPLDTAYIAGGIICENAPIHGNIVVNIIHRKRHNIVLEYNGDRIKCIALGLIPRMLKDYGLILRKINYQDVGRTFILKLNLKQYASELKHDPMEVVKRIQSTLSSITGKNVYVAIKYGLFGKEYRTY
ncbi:hypothetical protein [Staphylothermus hellenicus]|uniref:Uncharacterized protein n=1 Tax=Staphylothermus hellenicus (strain DSM 12710 / JCM 10830 / BK20S6-10-b1 / P8) TaxID=591019 RepID=D7DC73_STAHD|nr:hypothetical protein [Staphylothermus hellenicus]ADI31770.1 hypothetical protein Shell_0646 [Staphylothermus hellenicus DSM 12710]